jgi:hypothetical protein
VFVAARGDVSLVIRVALDDAEFQLILAATALELALIAVFLVARPLARAEGLTAALRLALALSFPLLGRSRFRLRAGDESGGNRTGHAHQPAPWPVAAQESRLLIEPMLIGHGGVLSND